MLVFFNLKTWLLKITINTKRSNKASKNLNKLKDRPLLKLKLRI